MSVDADLDRIIASSLTKGPLGGSEEGRKYAVAIKHQIRTRAKRRSRIVRMAAVLGAGAAVLGVYAFVLTVERIVSPAWVQADGSLVASGGGGVILLAVIVIAIIAESLPQSP